MSNIAARNADGQYVGSDGFVVPRNFAEFEKRYPTYVADWLRKRHYQNRNLADIQDLVSELTLHMLSLPEDSMFRELGYTDRIEAFNPRKGHYRGATAPRFFHYVKNCLNNYYLTMNQKRTSDPVSWVASIDSYQGDSDEGATLTDDAAYAQGTAAYRKSCSYIDHMNNFVLANEFAAFVREHSPELLLVLYYIVTEETLIEAREACELNVELFGQAENRIKYLREVFEGGRPAQTY